MFATRDMFDDDGPGAAAADPAGPAAENALIMPAPPAGDSIESLVPGGDPVGGWGGEGGDGAESIMPAPSGPAPAAPPCVPTPHASRPSRPAQPLCRYPRRARPALR